MNNRTAFTGSGIIFSMLVAAGWLMKEQLRSVIENGLPLGAALAAAGFLLVVSLALIESWKRCFRCNFWKFKQTHMVDSPGGRPQRKTLRDHFNRNLGFIFQEGPGKNLLRMGIDAGFVSDPATMTGFLLLSGGSGFGLFYLLTRRLPFSFLFGLIVETGWLIWMMIKAGNNRRGFREQFPDLLERLADSLGAGLSVSQAVEFVIPNLSDPWAEEMDRIARQLKLGLTLDQALEGLLSRRPTDDVRLFREGIMLQQQVGGNLVQMMQDMAGVVRERLELEKEVATLTAQGRLSAVIITLLVPVSLGILAFFPGYIDVLFRTSIGNLVLIAAVVMDMMGGIIVSRLIRIEV